MERLPELFPTHIRTWFNDFCDPKNIQPKDEATSSYRKAPPVTPQRFALPHDIEVLTGAVRADRLPPLNKKNLEKTKNSLRDVMEAPQRHSSCKRAMLSILSTSGVGADSKIIGCHTHPCSQPVDVDERSQLDDSVEGLCSAYGPHQPVPTLLVPALDTSNATTAFSMALGGSAHPSSVGLPEQSTVTARLSTSTCTESSLQLTSSPGEVLRLLARRGRRQMGSMRALPVILQRLDVRQPLLAVPPPGGWSGEVAMAIAMEEVRHAAVEEQQGEAVVAHRATAKHSAVQHRTRSRGESHMLQRDARQSNAVDGTVKMWRSRSRKSGRKSGTTRQSTLAITPRILGSHLARGTPTPKTWMRRHGDQRVPLMLTVASNNMPYRLPPTLQSVMHAERLAADLAANPPSIPDHAEASNGQDGIHGTGNNDDAQIASVLKAWSVGSKRGDLALQLSRQTSRCTSRCTSAASARSGASNSTCLDRDQEGSGSMREV